MPLQPVTHNGDKPASPKMPNGGIGGGGTGKRTGYWIEEHRTWLPFGSKEVIVIPKPQPQLPNFFDLPIQRLGHACNRCNAYFPLILERTFREGKRVIKKCDKCGHVMRPRVF
ncbi:MAG: hypothetical protein V1853_01315 [bacterium]